MTYAFILCERYSAHLKQPQFGIIPRNILLTRIAYYFKAKKNGLTLNNEENDLIEWTLSTSHPYIKEFIRKLENTNGSVANSGSDSDTTRWSQLPKIEHRNRSYRAIRTVDELVKQKTPIDCGIYLGPGSAQLSQEYDRLIQSENKRMQQITLIRTCIKNMKKNQFGLLFAFRNGYYNLARVSARLKEVAHTFYNADALLRTLRSQSNQIVHRNIRSIIIDYEEVVLAMIMDACSASYHQSMISKYPNGMDFDSM